MEKHAIFFDLDGTLLSTVNSVTKETIQTMDQLKAQGHLLFISTGRQFYSSIDFHKELGFTTPLITLNGCTIFSPNGDLLEAHALNKDFIYQMIEHPIVQNVFSVIDFETPNVSIITEEEIQLLTFLKMQMPEGICPNIEHLTDDNRAQIKYAANIYTFIKREDMPAFEAIMPDIIPEDVGYRIGEQEDGYFFEFYPNNVNKATGIQSVMRKLGIEGMPTMAFGDGTNDIDMITAVSHGVSMENGCPEAKAASNAQTVHANCDSGVARYLQTYFNLI